MSNITVELSSSFTLCCVDALWFRDGLTLANANVCKWPFLPQRVGGMYLKLKKKIKKKLKKIMKGGIDTPRKRNEM